MTNAYTLYLTYVAIAEMQDEMVSTFTTFLDTEVMSEGTRRHFQDMFDSTLALKESVPSLETSSSWLTPKI